MHLNNQIQLISLTSLIKFYYCNSLVFISILYTVSASHFYTKPTDYFLEWCYRVTACQSCLPEVPRFALSSGGVRPWSSGMGFSPI